MYTYKHLPLSYVSTLTNGRESNEHRRFLSNMFKYLCLAVLCNVMCHLKEAVRT